MDKSKNRYRRSSFTDNYSENDEETHRGILVRCTSVLHFFPKLKLWFEIVDDESHPELDVHEAFVSPLIVIFANQIKSFRSVVGNQKESFRNARDHTVLFPMDFAIVTGCRLS